MAKKDDNAGKQEPRTFLLVVDNSEELTQALRFACRRAVNTGGRIALLSVLEPAEFQHWMAVGERMREEAREEAEELLQVVASTVKQRTGQTPVVFIREGNTREELIELIDEETDISLLVLGASTGPDGPGPIISYLLKEMAGTLRVPVTIVPGSLTDEQIDSIA